MDTPARPRVTAADRARRRLRIFARMQEGWSYEAIAEEEKLSRERIRQIVKQTLDRREVDPSADYLRLQIARLDPALRLASAKVASGDLHAIDRLLRVLERMDKYQSAFDEIDEEVEVQDTFLGITKYPEDEIIVDAVDRENMMSEFRQKCMDRIPPEIWDRYYAWKRESSGSPQNGSREAPARKESYGDKVSLT